jgi:hypothetical protein
MKNGLRCLISFAVIFLVVGFNMSFAQSLSEGSEASSLDVNPSLNPGLEALSCKELIDYKEQEGRKLNNKCESDSDCILNWSIGLCGACLNKDESKEDIKKVSEIYAIGIEKSCLPQVDCLQSTCTCVANRCSKGVNE